RDLAQRQACAKAATERNEPDNVLENRTPITSGHAEFSPKRIEKNFIQNDILLRNMQIHAGTRAVVDDISPVFVEKIECYIALIFRYFRPVRSHPGFVVPENLWRREFSIVNRYAQHLTGPAIGLCGRVAEN